MTAANKITIQTPAEDGFIKVDAGTGTITISAKIINIEAAETININSQKTINGNAMETLMLDSPDTTVYAESSLRLEGGEVNMGSSGLVNIAGAPVKVNS